MLKGNSSIAICDQVKPLETNADMDTKTRMLETTAFKYK